MADDTISVVSGIDVSPSKRSATQLTVSNVPGTSGSVGDVAAAVNASPGRPADLISVPGASVGDLRDLQETPVTACSSAREAVSSSWTLVRSYASDFVSSSTALSTTAPVSRHPELSSETPSRPLSSLFVDINQRFQSVLNSSTPLASGFLPLGDYRTSLRAYSPVNCQSQRPEYSRISTTGVPDIPLARGDISIPFRSFIELQRRIEFSTNLYSYLALLGVAVDVLATTDPIADQELLDLGSLARALCVAGRDGLALSTSTEQSLLVMRRHATLQPLSLPATVLDSMERSPLPRDPRSLFGREAADTWERHRSAPSTLLRTVLGDPRVHPYRAGQRSSRPRRSSASTSTHSTSRPFATPLPPSSTLPSTSASRGATQATRRSFRGLGHRGRR